MTTEETLNTKPSVIGDPEVFAIEFAFINNAGMTSIKMFANGVNLLGYKQEDNMVVSRTVEHDHLGDVVSWLATFVQNMQDDPYPRDNKGEFAAQKDAIAREFVTDDPYAMDRYYFPLLDWIWNHSWMGSRDGAMLPNILFELKGDFVELSWDNRTMKNGIVWDCDFGGERVLAEVFKDVILRFQTAFEEKWGIHVNTNNLCGL